MTENKKDNNWDTYRKTSIIPTNEMLIDMMRDLCLARRVLEKINSTYYMMTVDCLIKEYWNLQSMARARGLEKYPNIFEK